MCGISGWRWSVERERVMGGAVVLCRLLICWFEVVRHVGGWGVRVISCACVCCRGNERGGVWRVVARRFDFWKRVCKAREVV